ncbi:hypothetical protein N7540_008134 [Penicillium herquei]|nr:hypothetical protein N7540_008134 [Penicillium herquei]
MGDNIINDLLDLNNTLNKNLNKNPIVDSALNYVIDTVSNEVLRGVFKSICKDVPEANVQAAKYLLVEKTTKVPEVQSGSHNEDESSSKTKVIAPRYSVCQNCEEEFATDENSSTACRYHPEPSQASETLWEDIEIDECHPYDSDGYREDIPEYFEFPCCHDSLRDNPQGCKLDWHVERTAETQVKGGRAAKKARKF